MMAHSTVACVAVTLYKVCWDTITV